LFYLGGQRGNQVSNLNLVKKLRCFLFVSNLFSRGEIWSLRDRSSHNENKKDHNITFPCSVHRRGYYHSHYDQDCTDSDDVELNY